MNRRRTIHKGGWLTQLVRRGRNRRVRPRTACVVSASDGAPAPVERVRKPWLAIDRDKLQARLKRGAWIVGKVALSATLLAGIGAAGFFGYRRLMTSEHFNVAEFRFKGARRAATSELAGLIQSARSRNIFGLDTESVRRAVAGHPWIKSATVTRVLPRALEIEVQEHQAAALLLIGHLYLVDGEGHVFKRASRDETEGLPVITGVSRLAYLNFRGPATRRVQRALRILQRYQEERRPELSELHLESSGVGDDGGESGDGSSIEADDGRVTLYLRRGGVALRLGQTAIDGQLQRFDAVWASLGPQARRARAVFLDNEARTERVTVRMSSMQ